MQLPKNVSARDASWLLRDKYNNTPNKDYEKDITRLSDGEPLSYVIGWIPFLGLHITLDSRPLIPRSETEWWTNELIQTLRAKYDKLPFTILDLGSGSGAIGCAILSRFQNARVSFGEVNSSHKKTILRNIAINNLDLSRADIRIGDLFEPFDNSRFNFIVSNPPYIPTQRTLPHSVTDYEPHEALYAGKDGLTIIHRIANKLSAHLMPNGTAWIEIDISHEKMATNIFHDCGYNTKILKDQYGRSRVLMAY